MSAEATSLVAGPGDILPQEIFKFGGPKRYFQHLSRDMSPKNRPRIEYENGKQLQVTIIKITESKENKSI